MRRVLGLAALVGLVLLSADAAVAQPPAPQEASADYDPETNKLRLAWAYPEADADAFTVWRSLEELPEDAQAPGFRRERVEADHLEREDGRYVHVLDPIPEATEQAPVYYRVTADVDGERSRPTDALLAIPWAPPGPPEDPTADATYEFRRFGRSVAEVEVCAELPEETGGGTAVLEVLRERDDEWRVVGLTGGCWAGQAPPLAFGGSETFRLQASNAAGPSPSTEVVVDYGLSSVFYSTMVAMVAVAFGVLVYRTLTARDR